VTPFRRRERRGPRADRREAALAGQRVVAGLLEAAGSSDTAHLARDFDMHPAAFEDTLRGYADELKAAAGIA